MRNIKKEEVTKVGLHTFIQTSQKQKQACVGQRVFKAEQRQVMQHAEEGILSKKGEDIKKKKKNGGS